MHQVRKLADGVITEPSKSPKSPACDVPASPTATPSTSFTCGGSTDAHRSGLAAALADPHDKPSSPTPQMWVNRHAQTGPRATFQYKDHLSRYRDSHDKDIVWWSWDDLVFTMGIPVIVRWQAITLTSDIPTWRIKCPQNRKNCQIYLTKCRKNVMERKLLFPIISFWFQGSHSSWKIIEIQICFKIMEKSLNFMKSFRNL